jgi:hypothetical protein
MIQLLKMTSSSSDGKGVQQQTELTYTHSLTLQKLITDAPTTLPFSIGNCRSMQQYHKEANDGNEYEDDDEEEEEDDDEPDGASSGEGDGDGKKKAPKAKTSRRRVKKVDAWPIIDSNITKAIESTHTRIVTGSISNQVMTSNKWTLTMPTFRSSSTPAPTPTPTSSSSSITNFAINESFNCNGIVHLLQSCTPSITSLPLQHSSTSSIASSSVNNKEEKREVAMINNGSNVAIKDGSSVSITDYLANQWCSSSLATLHTSNIKNIRVEPVKLIVDGSSISSNGMLHCVLHQSAASLQFTC